MSDPILVHVTRGAATESLHRVHAVVAGAAGELRAVWGEAGRLVFPRSAVKAIQALPLVETGAAARWRLGDAQLALACASHQGEAEHVGRVASWLAAMGQEIEVLVCAGHRPFNQQAADLLVFNQILNQISPTPAHDNCSGKHAAMVATALHLGEGVEGYHRADHPVQRRVAQALAELTGCEPGGLPAGEDGCGIPALAFPLAALARGMAGLAAPERLGPARGEAARRLIAAWRAEPLMVAGTGTLDSRIVPASGGAILTKTGAEGVYAALLPDRGVGVVVKAEDGAARAAAVALLAVLERLGALAPAAAEALADLVRPAVRDRRGTPVGEIRAELPPA